MVDKIVSILLGVGTAILSVFGMYWVGKQKGKEEQQLVEAKKCLEEMNAIKKHNDYLDKLNDASVRDKLREKYTTK